MTLRQLPRRQFLQGTSLALVSSPLLAHATQREAGLQGRLYKTLKIGMVGVKGSLADKFKAAKAAGFGAIELNAPGIDVVETNKAIAQSGLPVDGSVCSSHWQIRHTDKDPAKRKMALEHLKRALRQTRAVGGHTVLLVVGHGNDGPEQEIWDRSIENISQAVPLAAELGVAIAIENVWNHFCYAHGSGAKWDADQPADKFVKYVDAFNSPWVGMQFDIGNHWKYGDTANWIRALGKRVIKLDAKGFSRAENKFTKIGAGDLDWKSVSRALVEINFFGWCAAEVGGGDQTRLSEISTNMDRVFGLG